MATHGSIDAKTTWTRFFLRLFLPAILLIPFGFYAYGIQLIYDHAAKGDPSLSGAALFVTTIFVGSFFYDTIKKIVLLPNKELLPFAKCLWRVLLSCLVIAVGCIATAFTYTHSDKFPFFIPVLIYCATLLFGVPFAIRSVLNAIERAANAA